MSNIKIKKGDMVYFAGHKYEVAEIASFPHGEMVGIYDEPGHSNHIDYLKPSSVKLVYCK